MVAALALASALAAQEKQERVWHQNVIEVKYVDPRELATLVGNTFRDVNARGNVALKAVSLGTLSAEDLKAAEELIKRFDVPRFAGASMPTANSRNVEVTAYLMLAGAKGTAGDAVPPDLEPVVKQLRSAFGYADFRVLESTILRAREDREIAASGNLGSIAPGAPPARYGLNIKAIAISQGEKANTIRITGLRFNSNVPFFSKPLENVQGQWQFSDIGFNTDLDIREGQKVVVGKAKTGGDYGAFIMVLSARAVD
jgi:hypothetical protein